MRRPSPAAAIDAPARTRRRRRDLAPEQLARSFGDTLRVGDPAAAAAVIDTALTGGLSAVEIQSDVIAPAMRWIGEVWEHGGLTVAQEHLATALSHHVLTQLYPGMLRRTARAGDTVVVAAAHGEHHVLGLRMAADVLDGAGYDVRFFGADMPAGSLVAWVAEHRPRAVALGLTMPLGAATLVRELQELRAVDPDVRLIVGGQGVPAALREGVGVLYARDTDHLLELVDGPLLEPAPGDLWSGGPSGGVLFSAVAPGVDVAGGLEARLAETTAATADAARGQSRRAFALERLAFRDPLTDLWNRRAFDDRYMELLAAGGGRPPAVLMIDVDRFKSINDGFGHDTGDRVLIGLARCITEALRPDDFAARHGGDEFVVLLPGTAVKAAVEIGERIRARVERVLTTPAVTISMGVTAPSHHDRRRASLEVDRALYEAKERGRNQVAVA